MLKYTIFLKSIFFNFKIIFLLSVGFEPTPAHADLPIRETP